MRKREQWKMPPRFLTWAIGGYAINWGGNNWCWARARVGSDIKDFLHSLVYGWSPEGILVCVCVFIFFPLWNGWWRGDLRPGLGLFEMKGRWGEEKELAKEIEKGKPMRQMENRSRQSLKPREESNSRRRKMIRIWLCLLMTLVNTVSANGKLWDISALVAAPMTEHVLMSQRRSICSVLPTLLSPQNFRYLS